MTLVGNQKVTSHSGSRFSEEYLTFERARDSIDALDGLRTLAIVLVLFRHAIKAAESKIGTTFEIPLPWGSWNASVPMTNGWMGVDLFFVLSGFLIGGHLIRRRESFSWKSLGKYFGARALRIVPTYYCVLLLVAFGFFPYFRPLVQDTMPALAWHMFFLQDYLPSNFVVAFWSLGVEEKFYIFAPLLVLGAARLSNIRARLLLLAGLALTPMILRAVTLEFIDFDFTSYRAYFETFRSPFHLTFEGLMIGVICAEIYSHPVLKSKIVQLAKPMLVVGCAIIFSHLVSVDLMAHIGRYDILVQPFALSVGFGLMVLAAALMNPTSGWAASRFGLIGARLSYSLYLVHMPLIPIAMMLALLTRSDGLVWFGMFFTIFVSLSMAASLILHFAIEKPFLLLKSRFL